jgi:hypothetical protein
MDEFVIEAIVEALKPALKRKFQENLTPKSP